MKKAMLILLVIVAAGGVAAGVAARDNDDDTPADDVAAADDSATDDGAAISPGGGASARCVEQYGLDTLGNREVAFAGTIESIDGDDATFAVDDWYRGGDGETVTLAGAGVLTGRTSVSDAAFAPGDRVLVAGDGGFAWPCGFTQAYDDAVAEDWAEVFTAG